jgi:hypothetical protein
MLHTSLRHNHLPTKHKSKSKVERNAGTRVSIKTTAIIFLIAIASGCHRKVERDDVRPLVMHDVPANRLAYRFEGDTGLPSEIKIQDTAEQLETIRNDFKTNRKAEALLRTVTSPDGQRALALYATGEESNEAFRIDIYSSDGKFLRNVTPPGLSCVFPETVAWAPNGNSIAFIARRNPQPTPSPTPLDEVEPVTPSSLPTPIPSPSVAPAFAPLQMFETEQIYICNRDGYELKPLTKREGLIYFCLSWAPDSHALAALACRENEWKARAAEGRLATGRPRLITPDGKERLLDDQSTEACPVWSPDSSKVATGFNTDLGIYDAATNKPTQARIPLREELLSASRTFELKWKKSQNPEGRVPEQSTLGGVEVLASFNPIVKLEWPAPREGLTPETLYFQTANVTLRPEAYTFARWHRVILSPQAAILK